jgi:hypothetical protein
LTPFPTRKELGSHKTQPSRKREELCAQKRLKSKATTQKVLDKVGIIRDVRLPDYTSTEIGFHLAEFTSDLPSPTHENSFWREH